MKSQMRIGKGSSGYLRNGVVRLRFRAVEIEGGGNNGVESERRAITMFEREKPVVCMRRMENDE